MTLFSKNTNKDYTGVIMLKKSLLISSLLSLSFAASADWQFGGGYSSISSDGNTPDVTVGALYGTAGYQFDIDQNGLSLIPELRLGVGVVDDNIGAVDVDLDRYIAASFRVRQAFDNGMYIYAMPTYANVKLEAELNGNKATNSNSDWGYGLGIGYQFSKNSGFELSYEDVSDADIVSIGYKYSF